MQSIPKGPHYAIIESVGIYTPGDERSRTNPGHGYPASTDYYNVYTAYTDKAAWEERIKSLTLRNSVFVAIEAKPVTVTTTVTIK